LIRTLNDIRYRKCGGLFGVDAVARRSQGIVGVEENESPLADHHPAHGETDSKKNNFTGCKYEFMRARDPPGVNALLEEPLIT